MHVSALKLEKQNKTEPGKVYVETTFVHLKVIPIRNILLSHSGQQWMSIGLGGNSLLIVKQQCILALPNHVLLVYFWLWNIWCGQNCARTHWSQFGKIIANYLEET